MYFDNRYAESVGAKHFHTSAKLNKGIEEVFLDLSRGLSFSYVDILLYSDFNYVSSE